MELPQTSTRTLAEVNCRLCEIEDSARRLNAPACPDVFLHPGQAPDMDSATIPVRSPAGVWPSGSSQDTSHGTTFSLKSLTKPVLDHLKHAYSRLGKTATTRTTPIFPSQPPPLAWHPSRPLMGVVDTTDALQIFDFSNKIPYLGQIQTSLPTPLIPAGTFNHDLQKGAHTAALAWRPIDGTCLAVGCAHGVCLWHLPKLPINPSSTSTPQGASVVWLQSPGEVSIQALAWHPRGHLLAGSSSDRPGFFVWDVATGSVTSVRAGLQSVTLLRWSPCGSYLAAGGRGGSFRIWETSSWRSAKWAIASSGSASCGDLVGAEWAPDGRALLLAHPKQVTALHLTAEAPALTAQVLPVTLAELGGGKGGFEIGSVAWDPRGQRLAVGLNSKGPGSLVAIYDARCDPILTARFIGFARVGPLGGVDRAGNDRDEAEWEIVGEEEGEIGGTSAAVSELLEEKETSERAVLAFMPGFAQGAVLSVRRGDFVGTVPMYFSL